MTNARYNPSGGPLIVEIKCGYAQPGAYTIQLWEKNANTVVKDWDGNFINTADDSFTLPGLPDENDQRIITALVTIIVTPPINQYSVTLQVKQDGAILKNADVVSGSSSNTNETLLLKLLLTK